MQEPGPYLRNGSLFIRAKKTNILGSFAAPIAHKHRGEDDDNNEDDDDEDDGDDEYAALSQLSGNTVRWLNKRKVVKGPRAHLYRYHTTLANAMPYRPVFIGLDTAGEGDIELSDIEEVIRKVRVWFAWERHPSAHRPLTSRHPNNSSARPSPASSRCSTTPRRSCGCVASYMPGNAHAPLASRPTNPPIPIPHLPPHRYVCLEMAPSQRLLFTSRPTNPLRYSTFAAWKQPTVARRRSHPGPPLLHSPLQFFREMDTDGGGTVDFGEFAIGA